MKILNPDSKNEEDFKEFFNSIVETVIFFCKQHQLINIPQTSNVFVRNTAEGLKMIPGQLLRLPESTPVLWRSYFYNYGIGMAKFVKTAPVLAIVNIFKTGKDRFILEGQNCHGIKDFNMVVFGKERGFLRNSSEFLEQEEEVYMSDLFFKGYGEGLRSLGVS